MENSQLLNIWKQGNVTAFFKSGTKTKPENYRAISFTSIPGKLLERLIRPVTHMGEYNLFSKAQHGFVTGRSCFTQLLELMEKLTETPYLNGDVDIIYLEFKKALMIHYNS